MENNYTVYCHINKTNKKRYFGITSLKPTNRWKNGKAYHGNVYFTNAINKYGWNGFEHKIIAENLTKDEAEKMEIELISKYNSTNREFGYNIQNGGSSNGKHSKETKEKLRQATLQYNKEHPNCRNGIHHTDFSILKNKLNQPTRKEVAKIDLNSNEELERFISINEAARSIGCSPSLIQRACLGLASQSHGFKWQYVDEPHEYTPNMSKCKKVMQINKETNEVIQTFDSILDASISSGTSKTGISACCRHFGKVKTAGGFKWEYAI